MVKGAAMSLVLLVHFKAKPGQEARVAEVISELAAESRREPGCEHYIPCSDPEDPSHFVLFEQYRDREAFEAHGASEHFARLAAGQLFELADRERAFFETL
jgi:quinol monooxygenase YgiN